LATAPDDGKVAARLRNGRIATETVDRVPAFVANHHEPEGRSFIRYAAAAGAESRRNSWQRHAGGAGARRTRGVQATLHIVRRLAPDRTLDQRGRARRADAGGFNRAIGVSSRAADLASVAP
jgi:hypothetical protein